MFLGGGIVKDVGSVIKYGNLLIGCKGNVGKMITFNFLFVCVFMSVKLCA